MSRINKHAKRLVQLWRRRSKRRAPLHHRAWHVFVVCATILGPLAAIDQFWGRPWPIDPEIRFENPLRASSYILPFVLKNKSIWPMNNVAMTCGVNLYYFIDA